MKKNKTQIKLCMGSSCYSRGNDGIRDLIKNFLEENELQEAVDFRGHLCQEKCNHGPNLIVSGQEYSEVSESNIQLILKDVFSQELAINLKNSFVAEPELCMVIHELIFEEASDSYTTDLEVVSYK